MKRMKPIRLWAVVTDDGPCWNYDEPGGGDADRRNTLHAPIIRKTKDEAAAWLKPHCGERVVRVEIKEVAQ